MQAEIIAIGDEILIGQTLDTNSTFIATQLNLNGIIVKQKKVIADDDQTIIEALDNLLPGTRLVFMTGGLGPTKDDITKQTLTKYFGGDLVFHAEVFEHIKQLFATFNRVPSDVNRSQAWLPSSCNVILNEKGTACGMHFVKDGVHYFSTPGVPYETEHLIEDKIIPWIQKNLQKGTVVHRTLLTQGVPESELAEKIAAWETALPKSIRLAYLPSPGIVKLRLSCYEGDFENAVAAVDEHASKLRDMLGELVFGEGGSSLEEVLGKLLTAKNATVAAAESCTGGRIAHLFTKIAGSSQYFLGGVVAYSNMSKIKVLGVKEETLQRYGAVSEQTVTEMAEGVARLLGTNYAIATTGMAGPASDNDEEPVGTVWIGIKTPIETVTKKFSFGNRRMHNIQRASLMALDMLRKEIQKKK